MKKIISVILITALLAGALTGCSGKKKGDAPTDEKTPEAAQMTEEELEKEIEEAEEKLAASDTTVAVVGNFEVSQEYYNFMYKSIYEQMKNMYSEQYGENWLNATPDGQTTIRGYIKELTMEQIKTVVAANLVAKDYGITSGSEEIKTAVKEEKEFLVEQCGGEEGYKDFLAQCRSSNDAVEKYIEQFQIYDRLLAKLTQENDGNSKADALKEFNDAYLKVQYIFISYGEIPQSDGKFLAKGDAEAEFVAKSVIERLNAGESFHDMMDIYNEDAAMTRDIYHMFTEESVGEALFTATKSMGFGEYSKTPVKTDSGYYIIKRYEADENDENFTQFYNEEIYYSANEIIVNKVNNMAVAVKDDVIDAYTDEWIKELEKK